MAQAYICIIIFSPKKQRRFIMPLTLSTRLPRLGLRFNDFLEPWGDWLSDGGSNTSLSVPKVNVSEDATSYKMEVAAPGLHKKDFKIEVDGNTLTISGQRENSKEEGDDSYTRREYNYSSFSRSFTLPEEIEQDKIAATYDGGILKLSMPKNEKIAGKKMKSIAVK
jgi:HSP20 family protein